MREAEFSVPFLRIPRGFEVATGASRLLAVSVTIFLSLCRLMTLKYCCVDDFENNNFWPVGNFLPVFFTMRGRKNRRRCVYR